MNDFDRAALPLRPPAAGGDDQGLAKRMRVPCGAGARFKGDSGSDDAGGIGGLNQRIDANHAGEPFRGAAAGRLGADSSNFHGNDILASDGLRAQARNDGGSNERRGLSESIKDGGAVGL